MAEKMYAENNNNKQYSRTLDVYNIDYNNSWFLFDINFQKYIKFLSFLFRPSIYPPLKFV